MGVIIELKKGDLSQQPDLEAIVNAANADLVAGGGVDGAIHRRAGPLLEKESTKLGPIKPGQAVITAAYCLPNKFVIHCLGPVYGRDKPEAVLLRNCYQRALEIAEENKISSIGFPAISAGAFGYPIEEAAQEVKKIIGQVIPKLKAVKKIRFVLYKQASLEVYKKIIGSC